MKEIVEPIEEYALGESSKPESAISHIGIVGCGMVGRKLARIISAQGFEVIFIEVSKKQVDLVMQRISDEIDQIIERWGMTKNEKHAVLSRISGSTDYKNLKECDVVIEAVFSKTREKRVQIRKEIFKEIEKVVRKDTIIATNSTTLVISELAAELEHPERCVALHLVDPVLEADVVEVAKGLYTSTEAYEKTHRFVQLLDKKEIPVIESPGLISVRLAVPFINEACDILMEGIGSIENIDITMRLGFGLPLGPFEMADKIGIDVILGWMENLYNEFGDLKYKASPIIKRLVRANRLGRKTDIGFYKYHKNGKKTVVQFL